MLELYRYTLPFRGTFQTGAAQFKERSGLLLRFYNQHTEVLSEAAPLPGFSRENLQDVTKAFITYRSVLTRFFDHPFSVPELRFFLDTLPQPASLQFAVSYLGIDLIAKRTRSSWSQLLDIKAESVLKVNHVIGSDSPEAMVKEIDRGVKNGFDTFKLKAAGRPEKLADVIKKTQFLGEKINFRVDANQTWPSYRVMEYLSLFKGLPVEYVEEPVEILSAEQAVHLASESPLPLAFDESISTLQRLEIVLRSAPDAVLIIKPTVIGNLFKFFETILTVRSNCNNIVVTTSLESKIGRSMVSVVAGLIGDRTMAQGLNSGYLFSQDLLEDFTIQSGLLTMPTGGSWRHNFFDIPTNLIERIY